MTRQLVAALTALAAVIAVPVNARAAGTVQDLTPGHGVELSGTPAVAIGGGGRTIVAWTAPVRGAGGRVGTDLVVRIGGTPHQLGRPQVLARIPPGAATSASALVTVGPNGTAAAAWLEYGHPHNPVYVRFARPGRRFGPARYLGRQAGTDDLTGIGFDRAEQLVLAFDGRENYVPRASAATADVVGSERRSITRSSPPTHQYVGYSQVLQTASGGIVLVGAHRLSALAPGGTTLTALPVPPSDPSGGGAIFYAAGAHGLVVSYFSNAASVGTQFGVDIGATVLPPGGTWSAPDFVPLPAKVSPSVGAGSYPDAAMGPDGSIWVTGTFYAHVVLARAPAGGPLGPPATIGQSDGAPVVPSARDPQVVAFGTSAAATSVLESGANSVLHLAVQQAGATPAVQSLGPIGITDGPSLASNATTAVIAWVGDGRVRLWSDHAAG